MAQLSSVIGSILRDMISAQHEANLYSLSLSEHYGKEGRARDFQLPGAFISDMELELKYGVISSDAHREQLDIRFDDLRRFLRALCADAARVATTDIVSAVLDADDGRADESLAFFRRLKTEEQLNGDYCNYLSRTMRNAFTGTLYDTVDPATGEVDADAVVCKLTEAVAVAVFDDPDLDGLFGEAEGRALRLAAEDDVRRALDELVRQRAAGRNFLQVHDLPQLDVAVAADALAQMPAEAIHSFRLKFSPAVCNVPDADDAERSEFFRMK